MSQGNEPNQVLLECIHAESLAEALRSAIEQADVVFGSKALPSDCDCCGKELIFELGNFRFSVKRNPKDEYCFSVASGDSVKSTGFISGCPRIRDLFRCIEERIAEEKK